MPNRFSTGGVDTDIAEKLAMLDYPAGMRHDQKELDPDKPFDLLRFFNGDFQVWCEHRPYPGTPSKVAAKKMS